ncbi:MAG: hypothetical protein IJC56_01215 [Clostridia bacterium]|nr:hypothetical protein [Clostridia bacterium]
MKKLFALIICMIMAITLSACGSKETPQADNTVNASAATAAPEESAPAVAEGPWVMASSRMNSYIYTDYVYNEDGQIIKEVWFNETRDFSGADSLTYLPQEDGTVIVRRMPDEEPINAYEFIYDSNGTCIEAIGYSSLSYDPADKFVESNISYRTSYEYDDAGRLSKSTYVESSGNGRVTEYSYDELGRIISRIEKNSSDGAVINSKVYTYTDEGHTIQEVINDEITWIYTYKATDDFDHYGADGFLLGKEEMMNENGGAWQTVKYGYNDENTLVEVTVINNSGILPADYIKYFLHEGYRMEENDNCTITFKPLSLVLEQQNAQ